MLRILYQQQGTATWSVMIGSHDASSIFCVSAPPNLQGIEEHNLLRGLVRRSCTIRLSERTKEMAPIVVGGRCRATTNAGGDWTRTILCLVTCLTERQLHHGDHVAYKQQQQHSFGSGKVAAYAVVPGITLFYLCATRIEARADRRLQGRGDG